MEPIRDEREGYFKLLERIYLGPRTKCQFNREPENNKNGRCSSCTIKEAEFEFDNVLARLIKNGTIHRSALCPYRLFAGLLLHDLEDGPDAKLVSIEKRQVAIKALESAQRSITGALTLFGIDIEIHKDADDLYQRLNNVKVSQRFIRVAIAALKARQRKLPARRGGRPAKLNAQVIADYCLSVWQLLVGKEANPKNTQLQDLLSATWISVHGAKEREPDWEHQIKAAKKRRTAQ
jgi:hypothetical protein